MISTVWIALVTLLLLVESTSAFTMPSLAEKSVLTSRLFSAQVSDGSGNMLAQRMKQDELWLEQLQSPEIQQVRSEMLAKYIALGKSDEEAAREVDAFLQDQQRAQSFIEMRQYAKRKFDDMGLEIVLQTAVITIFCLVASIGLQYYSAYMAAYPNGGGPIPFW